MQSYPPGRRQGRKSSRYLRNSRQIGTRKAPLKTKKKEASDMKRAPNIIANAEDLVSSHSITKVKLKIIAKLTFVKSKLDCILIL